MVDDSNYVAAETEAKVIFLSECVCCFNQHQCQNVPNLQILVLTAFWRPGISQVGILKQVTTPPLEMLKIQTDRYKWLV